VRLSSICFLLLLTAACVADVLNVPSEQYPSIQQAINPALSGDTIIVAPGRYFENINFLGKAVTVRSSNPNDPNIIVATIIDGNRPADTNFASVVTFKNGETANSILEGFTITGGTGSWLKVYWQSKGYLWNRCGGGILCVNYSAPTIRKNIITKNLAGEGGGIYCYNHSNTAITDNTISGNNAIINHGFADPNLNDPNIYDHGDGGAIVGFQYCDLTIKNNTIQNNHAYYYGGGIHLRQWSDGLIENNLITQNSSMIGGGIHITFTSAPTIRKNTITANIASALGGGGIYIYALSNPLVEQNLITQNYCLNGAGIAVYWGSKPIIRNNVIVKNLAGAGIRARGNDSDPTIIFNTIANNSANINSGGIDCTENADPIIINNIISSSGPGFGIYADSLSHPEIRYNNVWANEAGNYSSLIGDLTGTGGNISADPGFTSSDSNNYHLNYFSPCINTADPNTSITDINDFDDQPRLQGQFVDIGALEAKFVWNITKNKQYDNIQAAINDTNNGQTIVIAAGTHKGSGNKNIDFNDKAVTVQSINPDDSSIVQSTIIDCENNGRAFLFKSGEDANSVINGLTITNGYGYYEGAIYCYASSPTIKNCIIRDNLMYDHGGAIYCGYSSNATISNCIFINNSFFDAGHGGGVYCYDSRATITNCTFINNSAIGSGRHGGAICCWDNGDAIVTNCLITGNSADHSGGGLYAYQSNPILTDCTVIDNNALEGGGINCSNSSPTIKKCVFKYNRAIDHGGAVYCGDDSNAIVANCLVIGNFTGHRGGGLYACQSSPTVVNCTVIGNKSLQGGGVGAFNQSNPHIINCIVRNNIAPDGNQLALINTLRVWSWQEITEMTVSHSNIEQGQTGVCVDPNMILHWQQGNIASEPNFVDLGYWNDTNTPFDANDDYYVIGNYHLLPGSVCINAGENNSVPAELITDIDSEPRIFDGTVDMGADEFIGNIADFNNDGIVDFADLFVYSQYWLSEVEDLPADFVNDGFIDFADFAVFAENWLWTGAWHQ
jgi:parallel beta-helix repeat protein/predicted outer membrane repeat protein